MNSAHRLENRNLHQILRIELLQGFHDTRSSVFFDERGHFGAGAPAYPELSGVRPLGRQVVDRLCCKARMVKKFVESLVLRTTFDIYGIPAGPLLSDSTIARAHNRIPKYKLAHDATTTYAPRWPASGPKTCRRNALRLPVNTRFLKVG
jgi:hypothetical protein